MLNATNQKFIEMVKSMNFVHDMEILLYVCLFVCLFTFLREKVFLQFYPNHEWPFPKCSSPESDIHT